MRRNTDRKVYFLPALLILICVCEVSSFQGPFRLSIVNKLYFDASVSKFFTPRNLTKSVTALSSLKGRQRREFSFVGCEYKNFWSCSTDCTRCKGFSRGCGPWGCQVRIHGKCNCFGPAASHPPRSPTGGRPHSPVGWWSARSTAGLYGGRDAKSSKTKPPGTGPREPRPPQSHAARDRT